MSDISEPVGPPFPVHDVFFTFVPAVTAEVEIEAAASGSGSYAEINFSDGTANFISPLFLSVLTV